MGSVGKRYSSRLHGIVEVFHHADDVRLACTAVADFVHDVPHKVDSETSDLALTSLDVATTGDSLTFNSRGILLTGGTPRVNVTRRSRTRSVVFNVLGRSRIN